METLYPEHTHKCSLGDPYGYDLYTLRKCGVCDTWWYVGEVYVGFGFNNEWRQVFWYHFKLRKRIRGK